MSSSPWPLAPAQPLRDEGNIDSPSFIVISGGTGGNAICSAFRNACFALPVSDDGGSSSEIIRVLGGPSIGDIRSRLIRLIPHAPSGSPLDSIRRLLAYRLPVHCTEKKAREEWREIIEGHSSLWLGIPSDRKEAIRGFLVYFENEVLKRAHKKFDFRNGSIGNYFLAAAQEFFRSLPSAIFLFSSITNSQANIVPAIVTSHIVTIAAELEDGRRLIGQCEISHPVSRDTNAGLAKTDTYAVVDGIGENITPYRNVVFRADDKSHYEALGSRIARVFYIKDGIEIYPPPNREYLSALSSREMLVYSCGSLWTSIIPCLALRGVAAAIARSPSLRAKILLLNWTNDRETDGYNAVDYVQAMVRTLNGNYHTEAYGLGNVNTTYPICAFVTHLVYLRGCNITVDVEQVESLGVRCIEVEGESGHATGFNADVVKQAIIRAISNE